MSTDKQMSDNALFGAFAPAFEYIVDAAQRSTLFIDILRQRGNQYREYRAAKVPHVLSYAAELVLDGRTFARPVNYLLARIIPPKGVEIDPIRRPFVVVDPRAGNGPGIGGFKADSEIGVALKAGHPCYFIGFMPEPMPGQTLEDVARGEAIFLEKVIELHPDADGKPCVIGNCQAGWAVMLLAAIRPELFGPIILAGSPLSYWAGVHGKNPMRYSGGLLGGTWMTALTSDMGAGKFDGAWLVQNFENQKPANTLWSKQYNVYSKVDTEGPRYLEFERWWGSSVDLNAEEIQFIVDELFVGNNLAAGRIETSDGMSIDLRNIRSPIVVFCSKGDNITPPQQALDWILDLYDDVDEIRLYGQTIVYTVHETIGHLGIFVSGGVAKKEHNEFSSNIDLIDLLPPGLYEAKFERRSVDTVNPELTSGEWVMRCEQRTLDDIRAMGGNSPKDERRFATAARVSEINLALYRAFVQPIVKPMITPQFAEWTSQFHPRRLQYEIFSDANPFMSWLPSAADQVRENREPVSADNPFLAAQEKVSEQIVKSLNDWQDWTERLSESLFMAIYGLPALQAAVGIDPKVERPRKPGKSLLHQQLLEARTAELKALIKKGGLPECIIRGLLYVGVARGKVDERGVEALRRVRLADGGLRMTLTQYKQMAREQYFLLLLEPDATIAAITDLLPASREERQGALDIIRRIANAGGEVTGEAAERLRKIVAIFEGSGSPSALTVQTKMPLAAVERAKVS